MFKIYLLNDYVVLWFFCFKYGLIIIYCVYKLYSLENYIFWVFFGFLNEENFIFYIFYENIKKKKLFCFLNNM